MTGKYYWLKLNEHFFDDDAIIFLKSQPNGYEYIYLWQRLLLKSLRSERKDECGFLRFSETLPYTPELLSEIFKMNVDVVRVGIALFQKIGLVQVMDDGTLYLDSVQRLVGKESDSAERMRRLRDKKKLLSCGDTTVTCDVTPRTCDANKEEEVEKEEEVDKESRETAFNTFWILYDKKRNKAKCITLWAKVPPDNYNTIFEHVKKYVAATPDALYRKDPERYIKYQCWNDEIITGKGVDKNEFGWCHD